MTDLSTVNDRTLWHRATDGRDESAFRALMTRHETLVWGVCNRLLRNGSDAEDAFQMTFVAMLEHGGDVRLSDFRPWLYRVAYRASLRVQSGRLSVATLTDANSVPEDSVNTEVFRAIEQAEQSQLIDEAMDSLPEKYRVVLVLHYCSGVARDEIAAQLGLTPQTVKARLSRARAALRSRLLRRGLSLSVAALLLGSQASAAVPPSLHDTTWQLAQSWLTGEPVGLDLAQFSDFPQAEYGMRSFSGLNTKWTLVGVAALLVLFVAYEAGRAAGVPSGNTGSLKDADQLAAASTPVAFEAPESGSVVSAGFVAEQTTSQPRRTEPAPVTPTQLGNTPYRSAPLRSAPPVRSTADGTSTSVRPVTSVRRALSSQGLPNGIWKRDNAFGSLSFVVEGNRLQVNFAGKGDLSMLRGSVLGEYSVASDGTVYGLFHGMDLDMPAEGPEAGYLGATLSLLSDAPFAMRFHTAGDVMVVKKFTVGLSVPVAENVEGLAEGVTMIGMYVAGTYRSGQQPPRVGQLPPRAGHIGNSSLFRGLRNPAMLQPAPTRQPGFEPVTTPSGFLPSANPATVPATPVIPPAQKPSA